MAIEVKDRKIGNHTYRVTQFGAKQANRVLVSLFKLVGGGFADLVSTPGEAEARLGAAVAALQKSVSADDLNAVCDAFASKTKLILQAQLNGGPQEVPQDLAPMFDDHFAGASYPDLFRWLAFAIEVNYASFLGANGTSLSDLMGMVKKSPEAKPESKSPPA